METTRKEVTIYDIAKRLNVTAATVSRGLKDSAVVSTKTKKRIFAAADEMGYSSNLVASNLRNKKSNVIGVIVPRLNSVFMSQIIAGIESEASKANLTLIISQSLESVQKEIANVGTMYTNRVLGLLVSVAYDTKNICHFDGFLQRDIPVIFFDRVFENSKYPVIHINNYKAAYDITTHLIEQGCRRIVHITANHLQNVYTDRFNGYKQALLDHGNQFEDELLIYNSLSAADGVKAGEEILKMEHRPDGVFAANDQSAISCMQVIKKAGLKIPKDMAFAGFNNDPLCCIIEPNLTTINYNGYSMGEVSAKLLIDMIYNNGGHAYNNLVLKHELIIRESSTGCKLKNIADLVNS